MTYVIYRVQFDSIDVDTTITVLIASDSRPIEKRRNKDDVSQMRKYLNIVVVVIVIVFSIEEKQRVRT
jgi:uncharacterized membrane protein